MSEYFFVDLSREEIKSLEEQLATLHRPYLNRICELNDKRRVYGSLSKEEEIEFSKLWKDMQKIDDDFNAEYPLLPCKECGSIRLVSLGGVCLNYGKCSLAIKYLGG